MLIAAMIVVLLQPLAHGDMQVEEVYVGGEVAKPGPVEVKDRKAVLGDYLNRVGGIRLTRAEYDRYHSGQAIEGVSIVCSSKDGVVKNFGLDPAGADIWTFVPDLYMSVNVRRSQAVEQDLELLLLNRLDRFYGQDVRRYSRMIQQSTSPDRRMAVYVGSEDGVNAEWDKIGGDDGFSFICNAAACANFVVDLENHRMVAVLDSDHSGTGPCYNHQSASFDWSPDGKWLLEQHHWKWHTSEFTVHRFTAEGRHQSRCDLLPTARELVRAELRRVQPGMTDADFERYAISMGANGISEKGQIQVNITGQVPKQGDPDVDLTAELLLEVGSYGVLAVKTEKVAVKARARHGDRQ